jgi:hypothetical protein
MMAKITTTLWLLGSRSIATAVLHQEAPARCRLSRRRDNPGPDNPAATDNVVPGSRANFERSAVK